MTQEQHFDVAAYALGVLDQHDAARFEDHLIDCPTCAIELESMLPVVDLLADLDADSIVATEQSRNDGLVLHKMITTVAKERRRANSRRLFSLAASVVIFALLSVGALFAGGKWLPGHQQTPTAPVAQGSKSPQNVTGDPGTVDPLPPEGGRGGPDLPGDRMSNTDSRSGAHLDVGLEDKDWGTQVSFSLRNVKGPYTCSLVAQLTNGQKISLTSWNVGAKGWGTVAQPKSLMLQAFTAAPRSSIAHLSVEAVDAQNNKQTLVTVPPS